MIFQEWFEVTAAAFTLSIANFAVFICFLIIITIDILILITMKKEAPKGFWFFDTVLIIAFVWAGWFPIWAGTILAIVISALGAKYVVGWFQ